MVMVIIVEYSVDSGATYLTLHLTPHSAPCHPIYHSHHRIHYYHHHHIHPYYHLFEQCVKTPPFWGFPNDPNSMVSPTNAKNEMTTFLIPLVQRVPLLHPVLIHEMFRYYHPYPHDDDDDDGKRGEV